MYICLYFGVSKLQVAIIDRSYKDAFVGNSEELCGRSTGMGGKARKNQEWWTTEVTSAIREHNEAWKVIEKIKVNGNRPDGGMLHLYGQKKKAAKKAVDKARNDMEADLYTKLGEDAGKKMIYKIARHRNENRMLREEHLSRIEMGS